jgi:MFS transporter, ACS family, hexuronate transporter
LIKRGWPVGRARKALVAFGGIGVTRLIPTVWTTNLLTIALLFGLATFAYASFTTIANVLPSDLFHSDSVASVSGLSGTGAGLGTIVAFLLVGYVSDSRAAAGTAASDTINIVAGLIPLLVRNTRATEEGLVRRV